MNESFSAQSVTALIGEEKAFVNSKCEVDSGIVKEVTVDEVGSITKVVIQGAKKATVTMEQIFETVEGALGAAIQLTEKHIKELSDNVASMRGRIQNIRDNP